MIQISHKISHFILTSYNEMLKPFWVVRIMSLLLEPVQIFMTDSTNRIWWKLCYVLPRLGHKTGTDFYLYSLGMLALGTQPAAIGKSCSLIKSHMERNWWLQPSAESDRPHMQPAPTFQPCKKAIMENISSRSKSTHLQPAMWSRERSCVRFLSLHNKLPQTHSG